MELKLPKNPHFLVDGDILAYRAAAAAEKTKYLVQYTQGHYVPFDDAATAKKSMVYSSDVLWSRKDLKPVEICYGIINDFYEGLQESFGSSETSTYVSGERNFRDFLWKTKKYKGNRNAVKPTHLPKVLEYIINNMGGVVPEGEADDAIAARHFAYADVQRTVIVSTDKDLDQLSGWHYDWVKKELYYVSDRDADVFLFEQIISGDATDNIPGLEGFGPKKAREALAGVTSFREALQRTRSIYQNHGKDEAYFDEQAELIYIRRDGRTFKEYAEDRCAVNQRKETKSTGPIRTIQIEAGKLDRDVANQS